MNERFARARALLAEALGLRPGQLPDDAGVHNLEAWDSLGHLRLVAAIERHAGVTLDAEQILALSSLADIASLLDSLPAPGQPPQPVAGIRSSS